MELVRELPPVAPHVTVHSPNSNLQVLQGWLKIDCYPGKLSACIACPWGCNYCITMTSPFHPPLNP